MPHIGPTELIIVLLLVVLLFGVGKVPEIGGALGKGLREFRTSARELDEAADGDPESEGPSDGVSELSPNGESNPPLDVTPADALPPTDSESDATSASESSPEA